jgi:hypothetical protein
MMLRPSCRTGECGIDQAATITPGLIVAEMEILLTY